MGFDTAIYKGEDTVNGQPCLLIELSDSTGTHTAIMRPYFTNGSTDLTWLKNQIGRDLANLNTVNTIGSGLTIGEPIEFISATPPALTDAQSARASFLQNYNMLCAMNRAIAAGLTLDNTSLKATVQSAYLPEYLSVM